MAHSTLHEVQAETLGKRVFFEGSGALLKGQGLCYDRTYGTAASADGKRDKRVNLPSTTNNLSFAGVAQMDYPAVTGGQWIDIYEPGSICDVLCLEALTIGTDYITCLVGNGAPGRFIKSGHKGRGTCQVQQSAANANTAQTATVVFSSLDGTASVGAGNKIITKTGIGTNARVGDWVYIVAGSVTASAATGVTVGRYKVADGGIDGATPATGTITLDSSPCAAASLVSVYVVRGNPTVQARLMDGEESGCIEWLSVVGNGASQAMAGGRTLIAGGVTVSTADATSTEADGLFPGMRKSYWLNGALTTNDWQLTVTHGVILSAASASVTANYIVLAGVEFDAAGDEADLVWTGVTWIVNAFNFTVANNPAIT